MHPDGTHLPLILFAVLIPENRRPSYTGERYGACERLPRWRRFVVRDEAGMNEAKWQAFDLSALIGINEEAVESVMNGGLPCQVPRLM